GAIGAIAGEIWTQAIAGSRMQDAHPDAAKLLLPALNAMIDITTTRTLATHMHPPTIIMAMLFGLALACALLAGTGLCAAGWPWHGRWHGAPLAPHRELYCHHHSGSVCHSRPGVPTSGVTPGQGL